MKVWAVTLDVSALNSPAFETVRGHCHVHLPLGSGFRLDLTPFTLCFRFVSVRLFYLVLHEGVAVCG